jgi:hypothetical protein
LNERLHALDPQIAWQNARVSISRRAISTKGQPQIECRFEDAAPIVVPGDGLSGFGRHRGAVRPCGAARAVPLQASATLTIAAGVAIEHRLTVTSLGKGAAR